MSLPKSLKQEQKEAKEAFLKARVAEKLGSTESREQNKVASGSSSKESKKSNK